MRKILALLLTLCLIIGLTACSGGNSEETADTDTDSGAEAATSAAAAKISLIMPEAATGSKAGDSAETLRMMN